ncbi:MAG TPA: glutamyl-tRNA reductase [Acidimicrobiales bacterium]|nr:glutamyl-tRNA reductase [Acidimicrobiales bacterium]
MSVIVVGIEHRLAPLDLLERATVADADLPKALGRLVDHPNIGEAVVLSTCLRTEIYAVVERFHDGVAELQEFLATTSGRPTSAIEEHQSIRFDDDVTSHLFTVAAGLDSAVIGESEVLGQVRRAWQRAQREGAAGPILGALFRHAVEVGKRVRSETAIARGITSLSHAAVALAARRRPGGLDGASVVVVGAGEMGEGVTRALSAHRPGSLVVVNRTSERSESLVRALPDELRAVVRTCGLDRLTAELADADVLFTTVGTAHPLVDRSMLAAATEDRSSAPGLVVVDVGVPRNVEPAAAELAGVVISDMDDLRASVADAVSGRRDEVARAGAIVSEEVERHRVAARARDAAPVVSALRARVEGLRRQELERRRQRHAGLDEAQWDEVDAATRAVVAKLLHDPTVALKEASGTPRGERLVEALRTLFNL